MKPFEILRTGKFTDSKGRPVEFTDADLDNIVAKYDPAQHEAPICIGHPKDNRPAWGWIEKLEKAGDRILATPKQLIHEFEEMVEKGMFKKRSASLLKDGTLRHIAFLGAQPPAIKGLAEIEFSENDDDTTLEFEEASAGESIESLKEQIKNLETKAAQVESLKGQVQEFADQNAEMAKLKNDAEDKLKELTLKLHMMEFQQFCQNQMAYGMLTPAQMEMCMKISDALDAVELQDMEGAMVFEFSDHSKGNPKQILLELIKSMPKIIEFSEIATKDKVEGEGEEADEDISDFAEANVDPDRLELHKKVLSCMKKDGISYAAALKKITKK